MSYGERAARKANATQLAQEIEMLLGQKTDDEWEALLQKAGVPCAKLRSLPEALASPQVQQRGFIQKLDDGSLVPTLPFRLSGQSSYPPSSDAPKLGADNDWFQSWLAAKLKERR